MVIVQYKEITLDSTNWKFCFQIIKKKGLSFRKQSPNFVFLCSKTQDILWHFGWIENILFSENVMFSTCIIKQTY